MKVIVYGMSCLLLSISGLLAENSAELDELTVVSYNIKHGQNMQGELKLEDTAEFLGKLAPDVVALQEVDNQCKRSANVDQAAFIGGELGMHHVFGKAMDYQGGGYGQAILSKYPILESKVHRLPGKGEPRIALEVVVEPVKGKKVSFVSVHLDYKSEETRQPQVKALIEALKDVKHPVLLLGDFNAKPESESIKLFSDKYYNVPKKGASLTMPADKPKMEIDYFMLRGLKSEGVTCEVLEEKSVSDHRPLLLKLGLGEE